MSPKTKKTIHTVYGIVLSVLIVVAGICFAVSCLQIYRSGDHPFSRESVAEAFSRIAIPVYLCLGGVVAGGILSLAMPQEAKRLKGTLSPEHLLAHLKAKLPENCDGAIKSRVRREESLRRTLLFTALGVCGALALAGILCLITVMEFTVENLNDDIIAASLLVVLPYTVISGAVAYAVSLLRTRSLEREITVVKEAVVATRSEGSRTELQAEGHTAMALRFSLRCVVLAVAAVFIVIGILNGGMADVLGKAVRICTECIGLG